MTAASVTGAHPVSGARRSRAPHVSTNSQIAGRKPPPRDNRSPRQRGLSLLSTLPIREIVHSGDALDLTRTITREFARDIRSLGGAPGRKGDRFVARFPLDGGKSIVDLIISKDMFSAQRLRYRLTEDDLNEGKDDKDDKAETGKRRGPKHPTLRTMIDAFAAPDFDAWPEFSELPPLMCPWLDEDGSIQWTDQHGRECMSVPRNAFDGLDPGTCMAEALALFRSPNLESPGDYAALLAHGFATVLRPRLVVTPPTMLMARKANGGKSWCAETLAGIATGGTGTSIAWGTSPDATEWAIGGAIARGLGPTIIFGNVKTGLEVAHPQVEQMHTSPGEELFRPVGSTALPMNASFHQFIYTMNQPRVNHEMGSRMTRVAIRGQPTDRSHEDAPKWLRDDPAYRARIIFGLISMLRAVQGRIPPHLLRRNRSRNAPEWSLLAASPAEMIMRGTITTPIDTSWEVDLAHVCRQVVEESKGRRIIAKNFAEIVKRNGPDLVIFMGLHKTMREDITASAWLGEWAKSEEVRGGWTCRRDPEGSRGAFWTFHPVAEAPVFEPPSAQDTANAREEAYAATEEDDEHEG